MIYTGSAGVECRDLHWFIYSTLVELGLSIVIYVTLVQLALSIVILGLSVVIYTGSTGAECSDLHWFSWG